MTKDLILVIVSLFTWGIGEGMFFYFQPLYLQQLGASPVGIGSIIGATGILLVLTQIPAGYLGDRFGRRQFLWLSWVIGCIATWVMAASNNLSFFIVGILLYGMTGFVTPPLNSYLTHARGKWSVAQAITFASAAYNLGAVAGPTIGGTIAEQYGIKPIYYIAAGIFLVSTIILFFIAKQPVEQRSPETRSNQLLKNTRFMVLLGVVFFTMFATYLPQPLAQNFLQNEKSVSLSNIGLLGSLGSLGNAVLLVTLGNLRSRRGFLAGQIAVLIFSLTLWLGTGLPWYMMGYFLIGGYKAIRSLSLALSRSLIHASQMGTAYGLIDTVASIAIILAPTLAGLLYEMNPSMVFMVAGVMILISIGFSLAFIPSKEQQIEETPVIVEN